MKQLVRNLSLTPILLMLTILATSVSAEIYKQVQPDGSVVFTDQPQEGQDREKVKLQPTAIIPAVDPSNVSFSGPEKDLKVKYSVAIGSPSSGMTFRDSQADAIPFTFTVSPTVQSPYKLKATLNGTSIDPSAGVLPKQYRGEHSLTVKVVGKNGREVASATSTFFVHRFAGG